jgi:hypothetical protein
MRKDKSPAWWRQLGGAFQNSASFVHARSDLRCVEGVAQSIAREGHAAPALALPMCWEKGCVWSRPQKATLPVAGWERGGLGLNYLVNLTTDQELQGAMGAIEGCRV